MKIFYNFEFYCQLLGSRSFANMENMWLFFEDDALKPIILQCSFDAFFSFRSALGQGLKILLGYCF